MAGALGVIGDSLNFQCLAVFGGQIAWLRIKRHRLMHSGTSAQAPTGLYACGTGPVVPALRVTIPGALRGKPSGHPRRASLGAPRVCKPRCGMHEYRRPTAGSLRSMVSAGQRPARGARRAPSLSVRGVFSAPRPHALFATVARLHPDARVKLRPVLTRSLRCAAGCGFRAGPCIWAPPGSERRTAWGSRGAEKTKPPTAPRGPQNEAGGVFLEQRFFNSPKGRYGEKDDGGAAITGSQVSGAYPRSHP